MDKEGLTVDGVFQYHRMRLETNRLRLMHQADEEMSFRISLTTVKSALVEMHIVVEEHVFDHLDLEGGVELISPREGALAKMLTSIFHLHNPVR
jgi:hypothetical protein